MSMKNLMFMSAMAMAMAAQGQAFPVSRKEKPKRIKSEAEKLKDKADRYKLQKFDFEDGFSCFALNKRSAEKKHNTFVNRTKH